MEGYIKLHRTTLDSNIFAHPIALKIWIWCLLKANYKSRFVPVRSGRGEVIKELLPGQFIYGRFKAEEELNISGSTIYKWLQKMQDFNMLKVESNTLYSVISIVKWEEYQEKDDTTGTPQGQCSNNVVTPQGHPSNTDKKVQEVQESKECIESKKINNSKHKKKICKRYVKDMETVTVIENKDINVMAVKGVQGENDIFERKKNFYEKVGLTYSDKYEKEMLIRFCDYWTEHNENGKKMRFEMQEVFNIARRLSTWKSNQKQFSQNGNTNSNTPKKPGELLEETLRLAKSRRPDDADTPDGEYGKAK